MQGRLTHRASFLFCDVEKGCIKDGKVSVDEIAAGLVECASLLRIRMKISLGVESALGNWASAVS